MFYKEFYPSVEAILFASGDAISAEKIARMIDIPVEHVEDILFDLKEKYKSDEHGITIRQVADGYQMCTKKEYATIIGSLELVREPKLSRPALETLSIIAFRQPVTKQEIEFIRGVKSERILGSLLDGRFIKEAGRKDTIGRPILYATTKHFLTAFGLNSLLDLPKLPDNIFPLPEDIEEIDDILANNDEEQ